MNLVIPYIVLFSVPVLLGAKHYYEYGASIDLYTFGRAERFAAVLFAFYIMFTLFLGIDDLFLLQKYARVGGRFMTFFLYPSFGFGIAIFPKAAARLTGFYDQIALADMTRAIAFWGWFFIVYLVLVLLF